MLVVVLAGLASAAASGPRRTAQRLAPGGLPLAGLEDAGLVGLDDAVEAASPDEVRQGEEAVAPAKRGAARDLELPRRLRDAQAVDQGLALTEPTIPVAQPRQWRARQRVERLAAASAPVALQPAGHAVAHDVHARAVRARPQHLQSVLDDGVDLFAGLYRLQLLHHLPPLRPVHFPNRPQHHVQLASVHRIPRLGSSGTSPSRQSPRRVAHRVSHINT